MRTGRNLPRLVAACAALFAIVFAVALAALALGSDGETVPNPAAPPTPTGAAELPTAVGRERIVVSIPGPRPPEAYLHVVAIDGSGRRQLTSAAASGLVPIDESPEWAPDGTRIAFLRSLETRSGGGGEPSHVYVVPARGGDPRRVSRGNRAETGPAWSPDGRWIAFARETSRGFAVFAARTDGSRLIRLTRAGAWTDAIDPAWTPDGTRIAFTAYVSDNEDLYVMNRDGSAAEPLLAGPTQDSDPAWSPDGRLLVFIRDGDVYTTDMEGNDVRRVASGPGRAADPSWSRDGRLILFTSDEGEIVVVRADGTEPARVPLGATPTAASWERGR
jgi:Tol biopolymer transport system component